MELIPYISNTYEALSIQIISTFGVFEAEPNSTTDLTRKELGMKKQIIIGILTLLAMSAVAQAAPVQGLNEMQCQELNGAIDHEIIVNIDWVMTPGTQNGHHVATVSRETIAGPEQIRRLNVAKQVKNVPGAPLLYVGKEFTLSVVATGSHYSGGGMSAHLEADTRQGRLDLPMVCNFVR